MSQNAANQNENQNEKQYVSIRVSTLRGDQKIGFDSYVRINEKYILYLRKGDSFEGERLVRLKSKKLKKMFIDPKDEENYRGYVSRNIDMAYDAKSGKDIKTRTEIIQGSQQNNSEALMENPEDAGLYKEAKEDVGRFADFLKNENEAFANIMAIDNSDQSLGHHCVTVAAFAVALSKKLGINDNKQIQLLTLGCLLHDIEHVHSGLNVARPISAFTEEEMKIYKNHPIDGARRTQDKKHFDAVVVNIIMQHEEFVDGKGFPKGLMESKMDPMAVIASSCNALDRKISFEGADKKGAAKQLLISSVGRYPLKHLQLLGELMSSMKI